MYFLIEKKRVSNSNFIASIEKNNNEQNRQKKLKDKCKESDMSFYVDIRII